MNDHDTDNSPDCSDTEDSCCDIVCSDFDSDADLSDTDDDSPDNDDSLDYESLPGPVSETQETDILSVQAGDSADGVKELFTAEESTVQEDAQEDIQPEISALASRMDITGEEAEQVLQALYTPAQDRTPRQSELADLARNTEYQGQKSFLVNDEGELVETTGRRKGTQIPDGFLKDEEGFHLREVKDYHDLSNLKQNISAQAAKRKAAFGEDADLTFVVASNDFTVEEAEKLHTFVDELGCKLEWMYK